MADVELDPALQAEILGLHGKLEEIDHYAILGVARDVDRKGVKSAYYQRAAKYHTDRHYGKKLGEFKQKLEQIFSRITTAHEVLTNKQKRVDYDHYLIERDRTLAYERLLAAVESGGAIDALLAKDPEPQAKEGSAPDIAAAIPELVMWNRAGLEAKKHVARIVQIHEKDDDDDDVAPVSSAPKSTRTLSGPPRARMSSRPPAVLLVPVRKTSRPRLVMQPVIVVAPIEPPVSTRSGLG